MSKIQNLFKTIEERGISAKKLSDNTGISTGNKCFVKKGRKNETTRKISQTTSAVI